MSVQCRNGRWRARVSVGGQRITIGSFESKIEAEGAIAEFWRLHATQVSAAPGVLSLRAWGDRYLDARETDGVHRAVDSDRSVWRARIASTPLGGMSIDTITQRDVRAWLAEQVRTPSARTGKLPQRTTVTNALNLLRVALEAAVDAGHLEANPARNVRAPRIARDTETWDWLRAHELDRLLSSEHATAEERRIYAVAVYTGLRAGELWGLEWSDVDLDRAELRVRRSYAAPTKGGKVRRVPLLPPALAALEVQRRSRTCSLVFPLDQKMRARGHVAGLDRVLRAEGLRPVRLHDLRHTCASHLVQGTWAPALMPRALRLEEARLWLGHQSITTTERYAHLCGDGLRAAAGLGPGSTTGPNWTKPGRRESKSAAQLAEVVQLSEPPIRIELMTYGLRNRGKSPKDPRACVDPGPALDQIRQLLARYARHEAPTDVEVVRALGSALEVLEMMRRAGTRTRREG